MTTAKKLLDELMEAHQLCPELDRIVAAINGRTDHDMGAKDMARAATFLEHALAAVPKLVAAARASLPDDSGEDIVRVLRVIEYVGPRSAVEQTVARSIHGTMTHPRTPLEAVGGAPSLRITAATIGVYPEVLDSARQQPATARCWGCPAPVPRGTKYCGKCINDMAPPAGG